MRVKAVGFRLLPVMALTAIATLSIGASCGSSERTTAPEPAVPPAPSLRLLLITDLKGYLEPCGCTTRPLGGIDRMAAQVRALRAEGVPTLLVAAGDLLFSGSPHGLSNGGALDQEAFKAETLVDILNDLELAAATPGMLDLSQGPEQLVSLLDRATFPMLAAGIELGVESGATPSAGPGTEVDPSGLPTEANPSEAATPEPAARFAPSVLREVGDIGVGFVGVTDLHGPDGSLVDGVLQLEPTMEAARSAVAGLRERGADVVVALVQGTRRTARRVASSPGVDFVVQAGLDEEAAIPPSQAGDAFLLHGGRQGQGLVVLDLFRRGDGPMRDMSEWTRQTARERLTSRITELRGRIADWEGDEDIDPADLQTQRARLVDLEAERTAISQAPTIEGNGFAARYVELSPESPQDAEVTALMASYDRRVNEHNRRVFSDLAPEPAPAGAPSYAGSLVCASCHSSAYRWWSGHAHGHAYETLEERHKEFNLSCVGCHVTGYMKPGGSTVTHLGTGDMLAGVGCESCHGPGSLHVAQPNQVTLPRQVPERICVTCHNQEHSDTFSYDNYLGPIVVPGHGLPVGSGS